MFVVKVFLFYLVVCVVVGFSSFVLSSGVSNVVDVLFLSRFFFDLNMFVFDKFIW